jgi:hypothetical protein
MHKQLWGYKVEEKLYVGVRKQKRLNTTVLEEQKPHVIVVLDFVVLCFHIYSR